MTMNWIVTILLSLATSNPFIPTPGPLSQATFEWEPKRLGSEDTDKHLVEVFEVPPGVYQLVVLGCGGGGSGGNAAGSFAGSGGEGAPLLSYAIPTSPGERFDIRLGRGGTGGASGKATIFGSWRFPGGVGGPSGNKTLPIPNNRYNQNTTLEAGPSHVQGIPGGRGGHSYRSSTGNRDREARYGRSGDGDRRWVASEGWIPGGTGLSKSRKNFPGGGGGAGINGPGGSGGRGNGGKASGHCAGGGGGGTPNGKGGAGLGGWIQVWYPDVVAQREILENTVRHVLEKIESEKRQQAEQADRLRQKRGALDAYRQEVLGKTTLENE